MPIGDPVSAMANGNIAPYRAIKGDSTKAFRVLQSTDGVTSAGDVCLGIAQKGERKDPSNSDGLAAVQGELIYYFGNGSKDVPAQIGGPVSAFQDLKSDANGKLVAATTAGDNVVAVAKQGGILDDIIDVDVTIRDKM